MACSERPLRFSRLTEAAPITLGVTRLVLNPGSVGQPRDGDPRASALVYEPQSHRVAAVRVPYDVGAVQERMLRAGLPRRLAARLSYGA
jgi:diadenosine tetraphosphatase ApaH/serine/threonine PP2A family protein phosphatase